MRVGIIEVCEPNHYTAVSALAKTYLVDPLNEVIIFTNGTIKPLLAELSGRVKFIIKPEEQSVGEFLTAVSKSSLDRIHINTISKYYKEFAYVNWGSSVYFTVHNIDLWYDNSFVNRTKTLISDYRSRPGNLKLPLILFIKDFWRQYFRDRFIKRISKGNYKIIVYSQSQKRHLEKYIESGKILVFPFCLHTDFKDQSAGNKKLRFCIPGSVSNQRRNYTGLFDILEKQLFEIRQDIIIDLLGYIPADNRFLLEKIQSLNSKGFEIIYNEGFIDIAGFDDRLSRCDIILGNLKVQMNVFRKYGETKETGVIFNIIKSGKPGIMPYAYPVDEELTDICLFFKDYDDLADLMKRLSKDRNNLAAIKLKAIDVVNHYRPESLYHLLKPE